jgi:DNA-directed RNA polymerase specialized sigma24 family protein
MSHRTEPDPDILARLKTGVPYAEMARELGVDPKTIRNRYAHLIGARTPGRLPKDVDVAKVIAAHRRSLSHRRIATEMQISVSVVRHVLAGAGLATAPHAERTRRRPR